MKKRGTWKKWAAAVMLLAALGGAGIVHLRAEQMRARVDYTGMVSVDRHAATTQEQVAFLRQFGYQCEEEPEKSEELIIPQQFNGVYEAYNQLQKAGGYDLLPYRGKRVWQYTYGISNYGTEDDVKAHLLVYNGVVIGGDVSSVKMDGFMECFRRVTGG